MHRNDAHVLARVARLRREHLPRFLHADAVPLHVVAWRTTGEPPPFADAVAAHAEGRYRPVQPGDPWGPAWATTWFRLSGVLPVWDGRPELVVDLGFQAAEPGFQAEGLVHGPDGTVLKGLEPRNRSVALDTDLSRAAGIVPGHPVTFWVEASSLPPVLHGLSFAPTLEGLTSTASPDPIYRFGSALLARRDTEVWEFEQDLFTLVGLVGQLPESSPRRAEVLLALDAAMDAVDPHEVAATARAGRDALAGALAKPAHASAHVLHAVGHAHIDSAWLWPVQETKRKVARTFANACDLAATEPGFTFAASSAQQYAWLKQSRPDVFQRVAETIRAGGFVPAGGMWVESDTNLPGAEAMVRQLVEGKRFFIEEFGVEPLDVWLPDSFGYSAALPQVVRAAGSRWFLTQKISWNDTNVMPHHTFWWEGIDGSRVFTHFPPVDTYNSDLGAADLARGERAFREKGRATVSLVPFGYGDGGGGPTREMVAAARRTADLEGSPRVVLSSPRAFFEAAEAEYPDAPTWSGELYLEFHRGTYTSQARTKQGNRRCEHLLREAELWATAASVRAGTPYPDDVLRRCWQQVLLNQFHDILPGSSIAWVYEEAERSYAAVAADLEDLIGSSLRALLGEGVGTVVANAGPFAVDGVPALGGGPRVAASSGTVVAREDDGWLVENSLVRARFDASGLLVSLVDVASGRDAIPAGLAGNLLTVHRDHPNRWDAWDIDATYAHVSEALTQGEVEALEDGLRITRRTGSSTIVETVTLAPGAGALDLTFDIDWHETHRLLKLAFPVDVNAIEATSEIQFGHLRRPTHRNTSWDAARFETVAHRWVHVGEQGFGFSLANDSTYGHDVTRIPHAGRVATLVRASLLRAPTFPDPHADQGRHVMRFSVRPGADVGAAIAEGYRLNVPLREVSGVGAAEVPPLFTVDDPAAVIEAVKLADDGSSDVVVRLYESRGGRASVRLGTSFPIASVTAVDLLERVPPEPLGAQPDAMGSTVRLDLRPFELVTLRFVRG